MDAFDMISEPVLFAQQLCEHSNKVHQSVELIPLLADALLAQDHEKMKTLHEQISRIGEEVDHIKLSLYEQIRNMHFHSAGGPSFNQYLACQDKVAGASQEFADLLVLRKTTIPVELHADFRAFVAQVVNVSRRTMSLTEGLSPEAQAVCPGAGTPNTLDAIRGVHNENGQARRLEMKFVRHVYSLEKQLDQVTILFLDKYCAALHEVADNAERTADHLCLMIC
jgi:predicted phosphate transport protein (TIGR00153 family)